MCIDCCSNFIRCFGAADQLGSIFNFESRNVSSLHISFFNHHIFGRSKMSSSSSTSTTYASDASAESDTNSSNGSEQQKTQEPQQSAELNDSGLGTREMDDGDANFISSTSSSDNGSNLSTNLSTTSSDSNSSVCVVFLKKKEVFACCLHIVQATLNSLNLICSCLCRNVHEKVHYRRSDDSMRLKRSHITKKRRGC